MTPTPLLFLGDSPSLQTGLGRIGRDLAARASSLPQFRVGFLGRGGIGSRLLPFTQYDFDESRGWGGPGLLDHVWNDFAGRGSKGIIFCIWDPSRLAWLAQGDWMATRRNQIKLWLYCPVDGACVDNRLTEDEVAALQGFDRLLAYGEYGKRVMEASLETTRERAYVDWLPHGIDLSAFFPRPRRDAKSAAGFKQRDRVLGCVMTNQARKDWAVAVQVLAQLPGWQGWFHTDVPARHWNIIELCKQFRVLDRVKLTYTGEMDDAGLAYHYSACDVTILPSAEGWGFPIAESLACGTPVLASAHAGGNWGLSTVAYMPPSGFRIEGVYNRIRPAFDAEEWSRRILAGEFPSVEDCAASVKHLGWDMLWMGRWQKWLLEGAR